MARALTGDELTYLRRDGQHSRLYLAIHTPATVFTARVNGVPDSDDMVAEITYDGGSADYADAVTGMTVWIGSTAGAYDRGMARLRNTLGAVSGTMKIGETSEIDWTDDDYITVVQEFALWARHVRIDGGTAYMDYEIAYDDQHENCAPVPVLGPHAITWLTGATVDVTFDAGDSWVPESSISTYAWAAPGASGTADLDTATPTITYDTAGTYLVYCVVTATNGAASTGYRYVFVYTTASAPITTFRLENCSGSYDVGGWSFSATLYDDALTSDIRNRALVILFARDWYGADETSIGPVDDRENIVAVGWIAGESIDWNPEQGSVRFDVQGPQWWLGQMTGFPAGVEDYDGTPTVWTEFEDLTVDKGLWHLLHWRTTASACMDFTLTGDDRQILAFDAPPGTIWQQLLYGAENTILARPCCDRYGRLFVEVDANLLPVGDRAGIPTVQAIVTQDWRQQVRIQRRVVNPASMIDLSGVYYLDGTSAPYFSLAPGHIPTHWGHIERKDRLALSSQNQSNTLTGLVLGKRNNPYPIVDIPLGANHRGFDIAPHQYGTVSISASDTERGIEWTNLKLIPRRVSFNFSPKVGTLLTNLECEGYTTAETSVDGDIPPSPPDPPAPPSLPPFPPPPEQELPSEILETPDIVFVIEGTSAIYRTANWSTASPTWSDITDTLTTIRAIAIDQNNRYIYAACAGGVYRASVDAAAPTWLQVLDAASLPSGAYAYQPYSIQAAKDSGRVAIGCFLGPYQDNTPPYFDQPGIITIDADATLQVLLNGNAGATDCPYHADLAYWGQIPGLVSQRNWLAVAGDTFTLTGDCRGGFTGGASHFCRGTGDTLSYTMTNEGRLETGALASYASAQRILDLGGSSLIGSHSSTVWLVPINCCAGDGACQAITHWTDITPVGLGTLYGMDRDPYQAFGVVTTTTQLYTTDGATLSLLVTSAALGVGAFRMCTCYADDDQQLFLATANDIEWTTDGGGTWESKEGTGSPGSDYTEIRPVWTRA